MSKKSVVHAIAFIFGLGMSAAQAQNLAESNWLFGNSDKAIIFNKGTGQAQLESIQFTPFGTGGSAVISDPLTGDLLFYTDGSNVYDINHELLPNGAGLNGNTAINRAAVVVPFTYTEGQYLIFTNSGDSRPNEIQYAIVDRDAPGNANKGLGEPSRGDITAKNESTGLTNPSEAMITIEGVNDHEHWLVSQERTTFAYNILKITDGIPDLAGIQTFDLSTAAEPGFEAAAFAYNEDSTLLAVAPKDQNRHVTLLRFDPAAGSLTFHAQVQNTGNTDFASEAIYDVAWSANGSKLYISRHGGDAAVNTGNLYQYALDNDAGQVNAILHNPVYRSYGIQLAPDWNIYHLYQLTSTSDIEVGRINEADSLFHIDSLRFNVYYDSLVFGNQNFAGTQFPAFSAPNFEEFTALDFVYLDTCAEAGTKFSPLVTPTPQYYSWDFGDGENSNAHSPIHSYQAAGNYAVTLTVFANAVSESITKNITVLQNDLTIDLGADTTICVGEVLTLDAGLGAASYAWSTLETTQTIEVDTTGYYWVAAVSAATGCVAYDQIRVVSFLDDTPRYNQWYFGDKAGIDFNTANGQPAAITDGNLMSSPAAAASISDVNGELLFYTNGVTVWNREHNTMLNGSDIGGDSTSVQGAVIVPLPGDSTIFYVFTTDPVWGDYTYDARYAIVDIKRDTARGEVVQKNRPLFTNSTERLTATAAGGAVIWLITHEYGNNVFRAYPITDEGIGAPAISAAGSAHRFSEERNGTASMKVEPGGRMIAVALQNSTENYVELFDMDNRNGTVSDFLQLDVMETIPSLVYGVAFSPSLQRLYVTTNGNGSKLIQYDLDSLDTDDEKADIEATKFEVANSAQEYGTLQTGPNGIMYMAIDNAPSIGTINNPNGDDLISAFIEAGFDLAGRTSRLGLPSFVQQIPNPPQEPSMNVNNSCFNPNELVPFTGSGISNPSIDSYLWTFGDGRSADQPNAFHTYNAPGAYDVSFRVSNRCGYDSIMYQTLELSPTPPNPQVPFTATICTAPVTLRAWPTDNPAYTYNWSTGETTRSITVDQKNIINVFLTDDNGCQSETMTTLVDDTRPVVDLGADLAACQNDFIPDMDAQNPGAAYQWFINGSDNANTLRTQSVDTSTPGSYVYRVEVTDILACVGIDSVSLNVSEIPTFTSASRDVSTCDASDGEIDLILTSTGNFTYQLNGTATRNPAAIIGPATTTIDRLPGGAYVLSVTSTVSGCAEFQSIVVGSPDPFDLSKTDRPVCEGTVDITITPSSATIDYEIVNNLAAPVQTGSASGPTFTTNPLPPGSYSILVTDNSTQCFADLDFEIMDQPASFTAPPQSICGAEGSVSIFPDAGIPSRVIYSWTGPTNGSINGSSFGTNVNVNQAGTYTVRSSDPDNEYCDHEVELVVAQNNEPEVVLTSTGDNCSGQITLEAGLNNGTGGNLGFQWGDGLGGSQLVVNSTGTYTVEVLDQGSGCTGMESIDVEVFNEITVFIEIAPNCDNNAEVFLTARANITEDVTFTWINPSGNVLPDTGAEISTVLSGNYGITVAGTNNNCSASDDVDILIVSIQDSELLLPEQEEFCSDDPDPSKSQLSLDPGEFSSYEWRLANTEQIVSRERIYTVADAGLYEITLSNGLTCIRDMIKVIDDCAPRIEAPNAFTPASSPGLNDTFSIYPNPYVTDFEIYIFSRQGEMVYQSRDIKFKWDGTYKGKALQIGTYAYIMRYRSSVDTDNRVIEQHGGVLLMR